MIYTLIRNQLFVFAGFHDPPLVHDQNAVAIPDGRQTVGDNECGTAFFNRLHIAPDEFFGFVIKSRGGFIEDQQTRIGNERPGNGNPLPLAAGQ